MAPTPRQRRRSFALSIVLVAANLFILNWIALGRFERFDLTRDGSYTLHPATAGLLAGLDDLVTMRVFLSEKQFRDQPRYANIPREIKDLLGEFATLGRGRLQVDYLDPGDDPEVAADARTAGVPEVPLLGMMEQSTVSFNAYLGIVLSYGGRPDEVIPQAFPIEPLEYQLALAISRLTQREAITIGFNTIHEVAPDLPPQFRQMNPGQDENAIDGNCRPLKEALSKQFDVEKVPLDREVPSHIDLLVVHNVDGMPPASQFYLDQHLMSGGKLIVMAEGTSQNRQVGFAARTKMPDALFAHYGFTIQRNMLFDRQCLAQYGQPPSYFVPHVQPRYFDPESALMSGLDAFYLPFSSSIELNPPEGVHGVVLAQTTPAAWIQEGFFDVRTGMEPPTAVDAYRQFDVMATLVGEFTSYFSNRAIPEGVETSYRGPTIGDFEKAGLLEEDPEGGGDDEPPGSDDDPPDGAGDEDGDGGGDDGGEDTPGGGLASAQEPGSVGAQFIREKSPETTIVVIGSSRFIQGNNAGLPGNLPLIWTLIDRMTTGSSLSEIRNRSLAAPSIRADLTPGTKAAIKYGGMLGMPLLVLVGGIVTFVVRRGRSAGVPS